MRRVMAVLWLSSVFFACSGSSSSSSETPIPLAQLPAELARSFCAAEQACNPFFYNVAFTNTDCAALVTQEFTQASYNDIQAAVNAGTIKYDGTLARTCANDIASGSCAVLDNLTPDSCQKALSGSAATGAACDIDQECVGVARCDTSGNVCPGKCAPRASEGVACAADGDCVLGAVCSKVTQKCVAPAMAGEDCGGGVAGNCASGLLCIGDDASSNKAGKCQTSTAALVGQAGDACDLQAGPWCADGLSCVVQSVSAGKLSSKCQPIAPSGGSCGVGIPSACSKGEYCPLDFVDILAAKYSANCAPLPGEGDACGPATALVRCGQDLICDTTTAKLTPVCAKRRDLGQPCSDDSLCYSQHCASGACVPASPCAK